MGSEAGFCRDTQALCDQERRQLQAQSVQACSVSGQEQDIIQVVEPVHVEPRRVAAKELSQQLCQRVLREYRGKLPSKWQAMQMCPLYSERSPVFTPDL